MAAGGRVVWMVVYGEETCVKNKARLSGCLFRPLRRPGCGMLCPAHSRQPSACGQGPTLSELRVLHVLRSLLTDSRSKGKAAARPDLKSYLVLLSANELQLFLPLLKLVLVF